MLILIWPRPGTWPDREKETISARTLRNLAVAGIGVMVLIVAIASFGTRAIHGSNYVKNAGYHTRFGPDAKTGKPQKGQPHA